jgi:hypothetical protein
MSILAYASVAVSLISCGGQHQEKNATDTTVIVDSTVVVKTETPTTSTIVTTPQQMMVVRHKVANFSKWLPSYEEHDSMRQANQLHSYVIGRGLQDSNIVVVAVKVDDMEKAKAFSKDAGLKKAMQKGGVTGAPSFAFVTMTYQDTVTIASDVRAWTTFTVKDWAAWEKAFMEGQQERLDNGLAVRVYGHDADNDKKVVLVVAVTDSAKAHAYWKSDMLKQRRIASGVVDEPQRFIFRVVKRY